MVDGLLRSISAPTPFPLLPQFAASGIYFLYRDSCVVYVGQAINMRVRIGNHLSDGEKSFDAVSCFPCERHMLNTLERLFICWFVPIYNRCPLGNQLRELKAADCSNKELLTVGIGSDILLSREVTALMLGIDQDQLKTVDDCRLPFRMHRSERSRVRVRRYRLADVLDYRASTLLAA